MNVLDTVLSVDPLVGLRTDRYRDNLETEASKPRLRVPAVDVAAASRTD
jgi:hypothetical protein